MSLTPLRGKVKPSSRFGGRKLPRSPHRAINYLCDTRFAAYLNKESIAEIRRAYTFAHDAHYGQVRKSGEHYIMHPVEVADTLSELRMDEHSIMAALLHDVIEDTDVSKDDIQRLFGEDVANLVDGVSKIGQIDFESREHAEAENFRKMLLAMSRDIRVIIIKLADRLHNMRTLNALKSAKRKRISQQTLDIYAPIANRLGLYQWSTELQDLCFRYIYPKRHSALTKAVKARDGNRKAKVRKLQAAIQKTIDDAGIFGTVVGRRKNVYSIYKKMLRKKRSFDELNDIYGFRIVVDNVDDCYRSLGVIHNHYKPIPGRFNDYIAIPKANGYQSLHTLVFGPYGDNIEIQIRTEEMNRIAEAGVAAHWMYKSDMPQKVESQNLSRQWLLDLLDPDHQSSNPQEFLEHLKMDLYTDEVYVFTPKGDIKKLPRGATALDFAYAVHTGIGSKCSSVKINLQTAHLSSVLKNGDHVEIITNKNASPNLAWLNYATTGRARVQIRNFLKSQSSEEALKIGKRLLAQAVKKRGFTQRRISEKQKQAVLNAFSISDWNQLLVEIGTGNRVPSLVVRQIFSDQDNPDREDNEADDAIIVKGTEGLLISYSRCCCPIPGDTILGVFTSGHGLVVHTTDCPNAASFKKQVDKCVSVEWDDGIQQKFPVKIRIWVQNERSSIARITAIIAEAECNISHLASVESTEDVIPIDFLVEVNDRIHLAHALRMLRAHKQVLKVMRTKG